MTTLYKRRNFSDLINDTFTFFKKNGKHFLKNYFIINGIFLMVLAVLIYFISKIYVEAVFSGIGNANPNYDFMENLLSEHFGLFIGSIIVFILLTIFLSLLNFSYPVIYLKEYEKTNSSDFPTKTIISSLKSNAGKIFMFFLISSFLIVPIAIIVFGILFLLSAIIIGIPFLILAFPTFFSVMSLTLYQYLNSDESFFISMGKAFQAVFKQYWPIIGVTTIFYIIVQIILTVFSMIPYVIAIVILLVSQENGESSTADSFSVIQILMTVLFVFATIANFILNNLLMINQGMIYYSRREQLENVSSFNQIDSIGTHFE